MYRKVTKILISFALIVFTAGYTFADGKLPPPPSKKNGNFSKGKLSNDNSWSSNGKAFEPPNPGDGTGGNPVPISNGLAFLLIGSTIYVVKRIKGEDE